MQLRHGFIGFKVRKFEFILLRWGLEWKEAYKTILKIAYDTARETAEGSNKIVSIAKDLKFNGSATNQDIAMSPLKTATLYLE